jgi:hypothetical protein
MKRAFALLLSSTFVWACSGGGSADDDSDPPSTTYEPSSYCGTLQTRLRECDALGPGRCHCENYEDDAEACETACLRAGECAAVQQFYCSFMGPVSRCFQDCIGLTTFTCTDGFVLSPSARCDGFEDCASAEDETGCNSVGSYKCRNVDERLDFALYCDGVSDCSDGSDEPPGCAPEVTCDDGLSASGYQVCDGIAVCSDGADEPAGCAVASCGG